MNSTELEITNIWNTDKREELKTFITEESQKQTPERILRNKLLSIQYRMEDYIRNEGNSEEELRVLDFVKMYLKVFKITKKTLAKYFEMEDSNLHKYLSGEGKLNADLAMKLGSFSHTTPEHWYRLQIKNELTVFKRKKTKDYKRYDFKNLINK